MNRQHEYDYEQAYLDEHNPMDQAATPEEKTALLKRHPHRAYLLFPQDRELPIRHPDILPAVWTRHGPAGAFHGAARPGEWYAFQIGVYAARRSIRNLRVTFTDLRGGRGAAISKTDIRCINLGGVDWLGRAFTKRIDVPNGRVQALWIGVPIPKNAGGQFSGAATIAADGLPKTAIKLTLNVAGAVLKDCGDRDLWRMSRLRWLDSTIGLNEELIPPFIALEVTGNTIACLGRTVRLGLPGLPDSIVSRFSRSVTRLEGPGRAILAQPMNFVVETADAGPVAWTGGKVKFTHQSAGAVEWESQSRAGDLTLKCIGRMEFDGFFSLDFRLKARRKITVKDIRLEVPYHQAAAKYMIGLGREGGLRRMLFEWKWDRAKRQDSLWLGDVNAGLRCQFYGANYRRPLGNIAYQLMPLNLPESWWNDGRGGCAIRDEGPIARLIAYSGRRTLRAGRELSFGVNCLITPFKPLDTDGHWRRRIQHHLFQDPDLPTPEDTAARGANIVSIHQGYAQNPFINYPFWPAPVRRLTEYTRAAHRLGLSVKLYYTVRELSTRCVEFWALRSLGYEVLIGGNGLSFFVRKPETADPWFKKHLRDYTPAWRARLKGPYAGKTDLSIVTSGMSRFHNYYLEGLRWLCARCRIDGLYIDDVAFDRTVMQRARRILERWRPGCPGIDLHSCNPIAYAEAGNASSANLYMEHFPYLERLWFGEQFKYDETAPDYWLIEVSGLPFGLMGEMLEGGGNPWRGMVFGMTARLSPGFGDPSQLWKFWDAFGMQGTEMLGWWDESCPVKTDNPNVLATVYRKAGKTLVALASWAPAPVKIRLAIAWDKLGLEPQKGRVVAPAIDGFQPARVFLRGAAICVEPKRGWLLVLSE